MTLRLSSPVWLLCGLGVPLGLMLFPLLAVDGLPPLAVCVVVALPVIFLVYVAAGAVAWWRRPRSGVGLLLMWTGLTVWVIGLNNTSVPAFQTVAPIFTSLVLAAVVHLLLAFPSGRLRSTGVLVIVGGMYVVTFVLTAPGYLFDPAGPSPSLALADLPTLVSVTKVVRSVVADALVVAATVVLARRLTRARPGHRLPLGLFYGYGAFVMLFVPVSAWAASFGWPEQSLTRDSIQLLSIAVLPVAVLAMFTLGGFRPTTDLEELGAWLGQAEGSRTPIETALANALGDPSLTVGYWSAELRAWVGADGLLLADSDGCADCAAYELSFGGVRVARVTYDTTVPRDPTDVERAASLVGLALERERLAAELRASRQAVVESLERLVGAADAERRRISRGLHDGLQARLLLIGIDAQRLATAPSSEVAARATSLRDDADLAAAELRAIVEDLVPPTLIELGLAGAVEELIESMPTQTRLDACLPERIGEAAEMTAYLVVAEALSNVVKHSGATTCTVTLRADDAWLQVEVTDDGSGVVDELSGTGLAGITDRVAASGGRSGFATRSREQGGGTTVWAHVPFGS